MELEGSLKAFSLPEILQFLSMSKMTGTLAVTTPDRVIKVMIREGKIVNTSTLNLSRKLGTLLVNHNIIQRHELDEALQRQRENGRLLGQILVEEDYISQEDLHRTIRMQLEEEVWDLFRLGEGDFKFEHGEPAKDEEVIVEIDIEPLIMEGSRQLDEWHRIIRNIPGDEYVVQLAPIEGEFEKLPLTDSEWTVLSYINGRSGIGSIVSRSTLGKFETYQALNSFLAAGMIEMHKPEEVAHEREEKPDPEEFVIPMGGDAPDPLFQKSDDGLSPNLMNRYFQAKGEESREFKGKLVFMSPIGQVAEFVTRYMHRLWNLPEFQPGPEDGAFVESNWQRLLNEYYRADIVGARDNLIDASNFERFVGYFGGIAASLRSSYEDSLEALEILTKRTLQFARDRVGERRANELREELLQEFSFKSVLRHQTEGYSLRGALQRV